MARIRKIYKTRREKQKAYRERKKKQGYKSICLYVPEYLFLFIKGYPERLVEAFVNQNKDKYIEFDSVSFNEDEGNPYALFTNIQGERLLIREPEKVKELKYVDEKIRRGEVIRLYPNGSIK